MIFLQLNGLFINLILTSLFIADCQPSQSQLYEEVDGDCGDESDTSSTCTDSATDSEYEDEKMDQEELDHTVLQVGVDSKVTGFVLRQMKKATKCNVCLEIMGTESIQAHNFINHQNERGQEHPQLCYPSEKFNAVVIRAIRFLMDSLNSMSHEVNIKKKLSALALKFDLRFGCQKHELDIPFLIAKRIALNCIKWYTRRECTSYKKRKISKKLVEEETEEEKLEKKAHEEEERRRRESRKRNVNTYYSTIPVLAARRRIDQSNASGATALTTSMEM